MFYRVANASKVAFVTLARDLEMSNFELIDCQMPSRHLASFGAKAIPRSLFLERLAAGGVSPLATPEPGPFPVRKRRQSVVSP